MDRFDALCRAYAEPHRAYHTTEHIVECLEVFDEYRPGGHRDEIEYALWLHDVVYEVPAEDNEERSAEMALAWLPSGDDACAGRVRDLILATRHRASARNDDEALVQDIDLHILGAAPARFARYEEQIRQEYARVPTVIFRRRRRAILEAFLAREAIFNLRWFRERFERQARENIWETLDGG